MLRLGNDPAVGCIGIGVKRRVLAIGRRKLVPPLPRALAAAVADVEGQDLPALGIQGQPQPLRVRLFAHKAPEFVPAASRVWTTSRSPRCGICTFRWAGAP